jgi:hypothetical protein
MSMTTSGPDFLRLPPSCFKLPVVPAFRFVLATDAAELPERCGTEGASNAALVDGVRLALEEALLGGGINHEAIAVASPPPEPAEDTDELKRVLLPSPLPVKPDMSPILLTSAAFRADAILSAAAWISPKLLCWSLVASTCGPERAAISRLHRTLNFSAGCVSRVCKPSTSSAISELQSKYTLKCRDAAGQKPLIMTTASGSMFSLHGKSCKLKPTLS